MLGELVPWSGGAIGIAALIAASTPRGETRWRTGVAGLLLALLSGWYLATGRMPAIFGGDPSSIGAASIDTLGAVIWWALSACALSFLLQYTLGHDNRSRQSRLLSDLMSAGVYIGAVLAVMSFVLKLPLSGLVATSGVVAVVLGLALQSTLADLFSGIAVGIEQPFRLGDRIKIMDGLEGVVSQINWRSVRLSTDDDDVAIVPNSRVAKADILNRSYPTAQRRAQLEVSVIASAPPERVEALFRQAMLLVQSVLEAPEPAVNLMTLGNRMNGYTIYFSVEPPGRPGHAKSEVLRQIRSQLLHAGYLDLPRSYGGLGKSDLPGSLQIFESLTQKQVDQLRGQMRTRALCKGDTLFSQGDKDTSLYVVADGVLEIRRRGEHGQSEVGARIGAGDYIGEIGMLTGAEKPVTAIALTNATVQVLPKESFEPLMRASPELAEALEASVRRGYVLLKAGRIDRGVEDERRLTELLPRIRAFFRLSDHQAAERPSQPAD